VLRPAKEGMALRSISRALVVTPFCSSCLASSAMIGQPPASGAVGSSDPVTVIVASGAFSASASLSVPAACAREVPPHRGHRAGRRNGYCNPLYLLHSAISPLGVRRCISRYDAGHRLDVEPDNSPRRSLPSPGDTATYRRCSSGTKIAVFAPTELGTCASSAK